MGAPAVGVGREAFERGAVVHEGPVPAAGIGAVQGEFQDGEDLGILDSFPTGEEEVEDGGAYVGLYENLGGAKAKQAMARAV
jgi:hypothetical protein